MQLITINFLLNNYYSNFRGLKTQFDTEYIKTARIKQNTIFKKVYKTRINDKRNTRVTDHC